MSVLNTSGSSIQISGAIEDTGSPLTAADANAPTGNPFTIPAGAIGMIVRPSLAMIESDACEISQERVPAKGAGLQIFGDDGLQYFTIRDNDNLHLHWVAGVTTFSLLVHYIF